MSRNGAFLPSPLKMKNRWFGSRDKALISRRKCLSVPEKSAWILDANTQENLPTLIKMGFVGTIFVLDPSQHQTHFFYSNKEEPMTTLQIENVVFGFVFDFESPIFLNLILHLVVIHIFWAPNDCSTEYVHCAFKEKNAFSCTLNLNVNVSTPMATDFFLACSKSQGQ